MPKGAPVSEAAKAWDGWGTALKPALEPIVLARKPFAGTVAANVLKHGTGALNIDAARVAYAGEEDAAAAAAAAAQRTCQDSPGRERWPGQGDKQFQDPEGSLEGFLARQHLGRWPANVVHDGSDEVVELFPGEAGAFAPNIPAGCSSASARSGEIYNTRTRVPSFHHGDSGSAARFFYTAKADAGDRIGSKHPTVKPLDLLQWLVRLTVRRGGMVLDPFAGSGTTGEAAWREGVDAVLIEREAPFVADIERRIALLASGAQTRRDATVKARGRVEPPGPLFGDVGGAVTPPAVRSTAPSPTKGARA